ncbi:hypothetical protein WAI453_006256 [Rhynchosporium graminicola]
MLQVASHRRESRFRFNDITTTSKPQLNMLPEQDSKKDKQASATQAREVIDVFHEISTLLNADLDRQTLSICISLIENGVNPEALASVIKELRKDAEETKREIQAGNQ